jgi:hypothetical protein
MVGDHMGIPRTVVFSFTGFVSNRVPFCGCVCLFCCVVTLLWVGEQAGVLRARHTWVPEPGRRRRQQTEGGHKEVAEPPYHAVKFRPYS